MHKYHIQHEDFHQDQDRSTPTHQNNALDISVVMLPNTLNDTEMFTNDTYKIQHFHND